ncbi:MAG: YheC/YheD family protein, partial [Bacillota bacterium]|nr:YheC/YheD family protein [Bacillota bacterium]
LSSSFNKETAMEIIALMKELSVETASILSSKATGLIGELGVDIGIDSTGKLWIIEVNSKPSKNFEDSGQKIRPSAKSILTYCTMLAFKATTEQEA